MKKQNKEEIREEYRRWKEEERSWERLVNEQKKLDRIFLIIICLLVVSIMLLKVTKVI